jgi:CSLREA domain-containing protein
MNHHPNRGVLMASLLLVMLGTLLFPTTAKASIFVVNTTDDIDDGQCNANHCSLREAINVANANAGPDQISFDLPGWDVPSNRIKLNSQLPPLTDGGTTIDGRTEPDYAGMPIVTIREASGNIEIQSGLVLNSDNNEIFGLVLAGFGDLPNQAGGAIEVNGAHNLIEHNTIGSGAMWNAVGVRLSGPGNNVIGNTISGNGSGIVANQPDNKIQGNLIGPDADGDTPVQTGFGVLLDNGSDGTLIGGAAAGEGNVISGNDRYGIFVRSEGCEAYGNLIGVNAAGTSALPNQGFGVVLSGGHAQFGGKLPGQGNVVSGNAYAGVGVTASCTSCTVQGNKIGTDITGTQLIPNEYAGISSEATSALIGGSSPAMGNLIKGNNGNGFYTRDLGHSNILENNTIIMNSGDGVLMEYYSGAHFLKNNTIANNGGNGIRLDDKTSRNTFTQNSIYDNAGRGINLGNNYPKKDYNNNHIQPPELDSPDGSAISGTACSLCKIEVFIAKPDPSGAGEGKEYLGYGYSDIYGDFSIPIGVGEYCIPLTATATDTDGNTSEFSDNIHSRCFRIGPIFLYPIWVFIIVVFGVIGWLIRRRRPSLPAATAPIFALGGGALFLVLILTLPFVQPEFAPKIDKCGNGVVDAGEACDGDDLTLCRSDQVCENCRCTTYLDQCGNGVVDSGEQCDGEDLTMCRSDQVCENCRCITHIEAEPENKLCVYTALRNTNCRASDHTESNLVEILMEGDIAHLIALNPEYTHGLFQLESGKQCWVWLEMMDGDRNPCGNCPVEIVDPPAAPVSNACSADMDESRCTAAGGEWVVGATRYCKCPQE